MVKNAAAGIPGAIQQNVIPVSSPATNQNTVRVVSKLSLPR
jgi:hypothetical protein